MRSNVTTIPSREGISKQIFILILTIAAICSLGFSVSSFAQGGSWTNDWSTPKVFIENKGQFPAVGVKDGSLLYAYDDNSTLIYFKKDGFDYQFLKGEIKKEKEGRIRNEKDWLREEREENKVDFKRDDIHIKFENSNPNVEVVSEGMVEDYYNYAVKDDDQHQHSIDQCRAFKKLIYKNIYSNIDLEFVFHPTDGIKYSFIVHPGGDPTQIKMDYSGMDGLSKNKAGEILIKTIFGDIVDHVPSTFYQNNSGDIISSEFTKVGNQVTFSLGNYDNSKTIVIDPWQQTSGLGFGTTAKIWECEHDNASNSYFWGGAFPKVLEKKFNNAGVLQWTYTSPWDTSGFWIGTFIVDNNGVSYTTGGSNGEISKVSAAGAQVWYNNPNGLFGPLFEYWHISFNCDQTSLLIGGMRTPSPFSINSFRGVTITVNMGSGAVTGFTTCGYIAGLNIKEVRTICTCPSGGYYYLTLDSIGKVNAANVVQWQNNSTLNFSYGNPSYSVKGNMGMSAIRANANFIYTQSGNQIQKRSIANGAILGTAPIPGGIAASFLGTNTFGNSGLDIDSCGNVYVGSGNQIVKYDANLVQLSTQATPGAVYDVSVSKTGQVVACGNSFIGTYAMAACAPMQVVCISSTLSATATQTNILCNGSCTGTATANPTGGTSPYTYVWSPGGQTTATATGLCVGSYTCSVTDAAAGNTTVNVTITQPTALTATQSQLNLSCNGVCIGTASVVASGGTSGYSYVWAPSGGTTANATGLCVGNYSCTITDANGCTHQNTFIITQPSVITSSVVPTNILCFGNNTGQAVVTASGGAGTFTYVWTPSGGTNATATGLGAGNYTCTITDANGCTHTQTVTITQPSSAITASATSTPTACSGNTGTATATASGGTGTLTYVWTPSGGTNANATGLGTGTYTCTITDANGCTQTATTTVTGGTAPTLALQSQTNILCNSSLTGVATMLASGGQSPYTYVWSPSGGTNANATGLGAGTYTCTVTDANGCTQTQTVTITQPTIISGSTGTIPATCGNNNGSASVLASGGVGPYTYSWAPSGGTGTNATGLGAGIYTVYITDANGCTQTATAGVSNSNGATVTLQSQINILCFGGSNGSATVTVTGGTSPYTYAWSPTGGTNATATGLSSGTYTVSVTDASGCTTLQTVTITQPTIIVGTTSSTPTGCSTSTGTASVNASGGTGPYTYVWAPSGGTNANATGLAAGIFTVTITDANGCIQTATSTVLASNAPTSNISAQTNVTCNGNTNGSVTLNVTGGVGPYTYVWTPSGGTNANATGLSSGTYTCTITDANGCTTTQTVTITQPIALAAVTNTIPACGVNNGTASATVTNGTAPYTYLWTPSGGTNANATGLSSGTYTCTVTDANGCTTTSTVIVVVNAAPVASTSANVTIILGNGTTLTASGGGTYSWSNGATNDSITVSPTTTTSYCVYVTNVAGCVDSACVTVTVDLNCGELWVPNAFSPNADGENDTLKVYGGCIKVLDFVIYDRWGEKVFETTDASKGWDGIYKGVMMNTAVFVYRLEAEMITGESKSLKGNITLVR